MSGVLEQAIASIKAGDKVTGEQLLAEALRLDPRDELAWLWMTSIVDSETARRIYLEQVLEINPNNQIALQGVAKLESTAHQAASSQPSVAENQPAQPTLMQSATKSRQTGTTLASRLKVPAIIGVVATLCAVMFLAQRFGAPVSTLGSKGPTFTPSPPAQTPQPPTATPDAEIQMAQWGTVDIRELLRAPDTYNGIELHYAGDVVTIQEADTGAFMQTWIQVPGGEVYEREAIVVFCRCVISKVYQGSYVEFWGYGAGTIEVASAAGGNIRRPLIVVTSAEYIHFNR
jgi:hypothetical protein